MATAPYNVELLLPTVRFVFWTDGERVEVLPEHRSPEAWALYEELAAARTVVGMTTYPNTVLLRGPQTILVDPGVHLQNQPVVRALEARDLGVDDLDLIVLTHAHLDHAGACVDVPGPVALHELELADPDRPMVSGILPPERLRLLRGDEGELAAGITWVRTPGHTEGGVCYRVATDDGLVVLTGDVIGPLRDDFERTVAGFDEGPDPVLAASWRAIASWRASLLIPGHVPPFKPNA
jgi:glyoxylase-like metal-dependent hydrolase (beta-lactamase superfamily II)